MSLLGMLKRPGPSGFGYNSTAEEVTEGLDLTGQTWLVTGCNSGLGEETIRVLAMRGAQVVGAARTLEKATAAVSALGNDPIPLACELSEPAHVKAAVATLLDRGVKLDGIIANAGIMALPDRTVQHGVEMQLLTNHFGHFLLITGLLGALKPEARVVVTSSELHKGTYSDGIRLDDFDASRGYTGVQAYGQSKLANVLFARELANRLPPGQTANALHPGVIPTNLGRHFHKALLAIYNAVGPALVLKTIPQGAATQVYAAVHPSAQGVTGKYFQDCNVHKTSKFGRDDALAKALWDKTEEVVAGWR